MIQAIALKLIKDGLTGALINAVGVTKDNVDDSDIEDKIVNWLNDHVDIPFASEDTEEKVIRAVIHTVKALILEEL